MHILGKIDIPRTMHSIRINAAVVLRKVIVASLLVFVCIGWASAQGTASRLPSQSLGSLQINGAVFLNGSSATTEQSVFPGDVIRTGPDGVGVLTLPRVGAMNVGTNSEIALESGQYLGTLRQGSVEIRASNAGKNVGIEFGKMVMYLPFFEAESAGSVTLAADGTGRVECSAGQVGVSVQEGTAVVFLKPGQSVGTGADGRIGVVESPAPISGAKGSSGGSVTSPAGSARTTYIVLGGLGAAGAGVGIALALQHHNPSSPSSP